MWFWQNHIPYLSLLCGVFIRSLGRNKLCALWLCWLWGNHRVQNWVIFFLWIVFIFECTLHKIQFTLFSVLFFLWILTNGYSCITITSASHTQPLATTLICFLSLKFFPFQSVMLMESYNMYVAFWGWIFALSKMHLKLHVLVLVHNFILMSNITLCAYAHVFVWLCAIW